MTAKLRALARQYPVVTLTGPRQSGKTVLCREVFAGKAYVSLEDLDVRRRAVSDPRAFLAGFPKGAVFDEIQRVPDLLSYIQGIVDKDPSPGRFVVTGSHQFELMRSVNQSLAGRTAVLRLLPFSYGEIYPGKRVALEDVFWKGFYPRIHDRKLDPVEALSFYVSTYIERDVRQLLNVKDVSRFEVFLKLCAGRTGQILNLSSLGAECGITHNTARDWLAVLEASYIVHLLRPHHQNFNKRLIKAPKLYFIDTGLASFLLDIRRKEQWASHPLRGALFETFVVAELLKARFNVARPSNLYYFRDNIGNEVDILVDEGTAIIPIEIKSGTTVAQDFFKGIEYYRKLNPEHAKDPVLVYGGTEAYCEKGVSVTPYHRIK